VSFIVVGTCTVDANQAGNAEYMAAAQLQQSFAVGPALTFTSPLTPPFTPTPSPASTPTPNSNFTLLRSAIVNGKTGAVTFQLSVGDPGTLRWILTFKNGKFGVFSASNTKCKRGQVKLNGKCRPSGIVFGKGSQTVAAPGTVTFTVKPSGSALKALKNALKQKKGVPVTATLTFRSSRGGPPVSHTGSLTVKLKTRT
jgi:hypothetical protein